MKKILADNFRAHHSALRFLLVLVLSVVGTEIMTEYLFIYMPVLQHLDSPSMKALMLVILLLPIFYFIFYRPMIMHIGKLERAEIIQRELSLVDLLTGLYNRRGFFTYANHLLKLADRTKKRLILIYADVDHLKEINDRFGHEEGDRAIVSVANILSNTFRESDVVGRVGGDEFAILAFEVKDDHIQILRDRLDQKLKDAENKMFPARRLAVSLGIISYNSAESQTMEGLIKKADTLMYEAKRSRHKIAFDLKAKKDQ